MGKFVDGFVSCDNDIITRHFFVEKQNTYESLLKCQFIFIVEKVIKIIYLLIWLLSVINKVLTR